MQLQQSEIDSLRRELELRKNERLGHITDSFEKVMLSEEQAKVLRMELYALKDVSLHSQRNLEACAAKCAQLDGSWQQLEGKLVAAEAEVKVDSFAFWIRLCKILPVCCSWLSSKI